MKIMPINNLAFELYGFSGKSGGDLGENAGFDLRTLKDFELDPEEITLIKTGIAVEAEHGHYTQVFSRSGLAKRGVLVLGGVIDPGYRGQVMVLLYNISDYSIRFNAGDAVAQLVEIKINNKYEIVQSLSESDRGDKGFGSSGRRGRL